MDSPALVYEKGWRITASGADPTEPDAPWQEPAGVLRFTYTGAELALLLAPGDYWGYLYITVDGQPANDLPFTYLANGQLERATPLVEVAHALWREQDNQPMLADSLTTAGLLYALAGEFDKAVSLSDEAYDICAAIGNVWGQSYSRTTISIVYWQRGDVQGAFDMLETAIKYGDQSGFFVSQIWCRLHLALAYGYLGQTGRGHVLAQEALGRTGRVVGTYLTALRVLAWSVVAQLHLLDGNLAQAIEAVRESQVDEEISGPVALVVWVVVKPRIEVALAQGNLAEAAEFSANLRDGAGGPTSRMHLPPALHLLAQTQLATGKREAGVSTLREARAVAEAIGSRWPLWCILADLWRVALECGDTGEAESLRREAAAVLQEVIASIGAEDLRQSFVALPQVRELLSAGG